MARVRKQKKEEISVSFHYLVRENESEETLIPFTEEEFASLYEELIKLKQLDLGDEETKDRIRFKVQAVIERVEKINDKTICGRYKGGYSGHSYENTHKGDIPAESISLRPFFFLLYLSDTGRIYIATQYIGGFGGYTPLRHTVLSCIKNAKNVHSKSFNSSSSYYIENAQAKEVQITVSKQNSNIVKPNIFNRSVAISVKKQTKNDGFEISVQEDILKHTGKSEIELKKILAQLIPQELMEVKDEDIEDCTVFAVIEGSSNKKPIRLFEGSSYASKYPVNVPITKEGHPEYEPLKQETLKLLKHQIIARKEAI